MVGHHLGQLVLRIGLAATFLTFGLSKVLREAPFEGEAAAALANMGVITPQTPVGDSETDEGGEAPIAYQPDEPAADPEQPAEQPADEPPSRATQPEEPDIRSLNPGRDAEQEEEAQPEATPPATQGQRYTAADFPEPVMLPRVYQIALLLKAHAHPAPNADGTDRMALVPSWAADTRVPGLNMATPVVLAWLAAITEIVGGAMLLVGFMSRLWALGLVGVMLTAIWLTAIGPAMQGGTAFLGFLPNKGDIFALDDHGGTVYMHEFWQFALLCMAAAVLFAGPGAISVDGILFGGGGDGDGGDDD